MYDKAFIVKYMQRLKTRLFFDSFIGRVGAHLFLLNFFYR
jgi:hypothetical protein